MSAFPFFDSAICRHLIARPDRSQARVLSLLDLAKSPERLFASLDGPFGRKLAGCAEGVGRASVRLDFAIAAAE
jgi:hypothetical protein